MTKMRIEKDSMGTLEVPINALYQAQTQRAINNFTISNLTMPASFIQAVVYIKYAAAQTNAELGHLEADRAIAIEQACEQLIDAKHQDQFPVDVFQTGSGTSSNMNVNEVIASLASKISGSKITPNDDVNMSQSSNDVIPTAIQISTSINIYFNLLPALEHLLLTLDKKSSEIGHLVKTGRTHLMDAMPVTFGQTLNAWKSQIQNAKIGIISCLEQLTAIGQGGTAVGTGINADEKFADKFSSNLSAATGVSFKPSANFFYNISSQDVIVSLSGHLKVLAVANMKIANDLRWMNSGPIAGLGEIELEALQPGSSIMPGKVNPVVPEAVAMVSAQVIGNDATITIGGQAGNFELNVMLPVIAYNILQSIELLTSASHLLANKAISSFKVNEAKINQDLSKNPILVTALNPIIGYLKAAEIAKKAYKEGKDIIEIAEQETYLSKDELKKLLDPKKLTKGGIVSN